MEHNSTGNDNFTPAPHNVVIDDKVVKRMTGEAIAGIDGILGVKGGLGDVLKNDSDPTRGVTVQVGEDQSATVCVRVITEAGKNIPDIVNKATAAVTEALQNTAGLRVKEVAIEVVDTMSRDEYEGKASADEAALS